MAGYSGTPLAKKLGVKDGFRVWFVSEPDHFDQDLALPTDIRIVFAKTKPLDLILLFTKSEVKLYRDFATWAQKLRSNGMLWVCWPKKASGVATDVTESIV